MKHLLLVPLLLFCAPAFATEGPSEKKSDTIRDLMHDFAKTLAKARAFSTRGTPLKEEDETSVRSELEVLNKRVQELKMDQLPPSTSYRLSLKAIQTHVADTERVYRLGNRQYARWMLNATTSLCVMCHTQLPESKQLQSFWTYKPSLSTVEDRFQEAEFLFVTRRFFQAMPYYESSIDEFPGNDLNVVDLDQALRRELTYFARIKRDPKAGLKAMEKALENKKLPEATRQNVEAWAALFRKWSKEREPNFDKMTGKELAAYVKKQLSKTLWDRMVEANDPRIVTYLKVSGLMHEFLLNHPKDSATPEILLYLGRTENFLNNQFFFSLGDLYLRDCINSFAPSDTTKECFSELERSLTQAYTMTTGKFFPREIEEELAGYRKKLGIKSK